MSEGDIQFGDIENRPIEKGERPDQDRAFAITEYGEPAPDDIPIYMSLEAFADIETHAHSDTSVELGGVLLGKQHVDDRGNPFIVVTDSLRAKHYDSSISRFTYTAETWTEINREQQEVAPELDIVGWYHTHPGWGIFLSGHDTFIHENYFAQALDTAYVVDPVNNDRGFFCWQTDGEIRRLPRMAGFYVTAPRAERAALEDTVARVEGRRVPEYAGGGGGGGQPIIVQAPAGGRGLLTGAGLAVLILLVMTQLGVMLSMYTRLLEGPAARPDTEKLTLLAANEEMRRSLDKLARMTLAGERLEGEREALRLMIGDLKIGDEPFLKKYQALAEETAAQRDKAALAEGRSKVVTDAALAIHNEKESLKSELERTKKQVESLAAQKARADELAAKNAELTKQADAAAAAQKKANEDYEKNRKDLERYRENKDKLEELEAAQDQSRHWFQIAVFVALPVALAGWGWSLLLSRRLHAAREQIEELSAKPAKPASPDGDHNRPAAPSDPAPAASATASSAPVGRPGEEMRLD